MDKQLAAYLVSIGAVKLNVNSPFRWASGWSSPIYCDNRLTLAYHDIREFVANSLMELLQKHYPQTTCIAGVATAGIPHATLLAYKTKLPLIYIRSAAKAHGMGNKIEGVLNSNDKVLVIEDLISTGKSSLEAVEAIRQQGAEVAGMLGLFTYQFQLATEAFAKAECTLHTISNYECVIPEAIKAGQVSNADIDTLQQWRLSPENWGK